MAPWRVGSVVAGPAVQAARLARRRPSSASRPGAPRARPATGPRAYAGPQMIVAPATTSASCAASPRRKQPHAGQNVTLAVWRTRRHIPPVDPRHRRAVRRRQGHGLACAGRGPRLSPHRHRRDVSRRRLEGARRRACRSTTRRRWPTWPRASRCRWRDGAVVVDGVDVTRAIRTPEMDQAAAAVARMPRVRAVLVDRQRALGRDPAAS